MKAMLITLALLMSTASAYAVNDDVSEFDHHAAAKQIEVTPYAAETFDMSSTRSLSQAGYNHLNTNKTLVHVAGEYGILPQVAVGANIGMSTQSTKVSGGAADGHRVNANGFDDLLFYARGHEHVGPGSIVYGLDFDVAAAKSTTDSDGSLNSATGGYYLNPYLGYEAKLQKVGFVGGRIHYQYQGDRKTKDESVSPNTEDTVKGGDIYGVALFVEHPVSVDTVLGVAFTYDQQASTKEADTSNVDKNHQIGFQVYAPVTLKIVEIIPKITYAHVGYDSQANDLKMSDPWTFEVAGRFYF